MSDSLFRCDPLPWRSDHESKECPPEESVNLLAALDSGNLNRAHLFAQRLMWDLRGLDDLGLAFVDKECSPKETARLLFFTLVKFRSTQIIYEQRGEDRNLWDARFALAATRQHRGVVRIGNYRCGSSTALAVYNLSVHVSTRLDFSFG